MKKELHVTQTAKLAIEKDKKLVDLEGCYWLNWLITKDLKNIQSQSLNLNTNLQNIYSILFLLL